MLPILSNGTFPYYQIGLVSYAEGCARKNLPTVYTNIPYHIDWISEKIQEKKIRSIEMAVENVPATEDFV